ncbi:hypothetical protein KZC52_07270 [Microbacterium sp. kSW2-24]|uniref:hypothetical protein n=1 Tax=Microbacterium galbinum TaxID=2851646 RepID=UPI001FFC6BD9|nr:hypothetical protein [Microbacterium galbinum]MCK2022718.1 hypothetical protein [Microbacterium galbinum]
MAEPAVADAAIMLFGVSSTSMVGALLIVNPRTAIRLNVKGIRALADVYGQKATERIVRDADPKWAVNFGIGLLAMALASLVILFFRLHVPLAVQTTAMVAGLGALQVLATVALLAIRQRNRRSRAFTRRSSSTRDRIRINAMIVGSCGVSTLILLAVLLATVPIGG